MPTTMKKNEEELTITIKLPRAEWETFFEEFKAMFNRMFKYGGPPGGYG